MALPYSTSQILFNSVGATANAVMSDDVAQNAAVIEVQLILAAFSGTVEFDGSIDGATWVALPYQTLASGALTSNSAQLSFTTSTTNPTYILPTPMPHMRIAMTRSAGTISAYARGFSNPFDLTSSLYPAGASALTPWNTVTFVKPDVTVAGSSGAWTTANSPITPFTVTGLVLMRIFGVVTTSFASTSNTGAIRLGVAGSTTIFCASVVADGTNLLNGYTWSSVSVASVNNWQQSGGAFIPANGSAVQLLITTNNMTAGGMTLYAQWVPVTAGATVTAATP